MPWRGTDQTTTKLVNNLQTMIKRLWNWINMIKGTVMILYCLDGSKGNENYDKIQSSDLILSGFVLYFSFNFLRARCCLVPGCFCNVFIISKKYTMHYYNVLLLAVWITYENLCTYIMNNSFFRFIDIKVNTKISQR